MPVRRSLKTVTSKDSGVQTDPEEDTDYQSPLLKNSKHVQYTDTNHHAVDKLKNDSSESCFSRWTLEPLMFLFMFSYMVSTSCLTNMILQKACLNHFNYSSEICNNMSYYEEQKINVEQLGTDYSQYNMLIHLALGALTMIFIGPWSDRYGRKLPLIISLIGAIIHDVGLILNAYYFEWPLYNILFPPIPLGMTGGLICVMSTIYSMVSEISDQKYRTIKYAFIELGFGLGLAFGGLAGGYLFDAYSYIPVFAVATIGHGISLPWAIFAVPETRKYDGKETSWKQKIAYLLSFENLSAGFKACLKPRPNYGRAQLWLLMMSMGPIIVTYVSFSSIAYTYVFHRFNWGPSEYAKVNTVFSILGMAVGVTLIPVFMKVLKVRDPGLGLMGSLSMAAKNICLAFAVQPWIYYLGSVLGIFSGIGMLAIRSRISKLVDKDELGKVFTFLSSCESLVPVLGTLAMTYVFNATLSTFPGLTYLLAGILLIFPTIVFVWLTRLKPLPITVTSESSINGDATHA